ncbi:unnamed protein product [Linum trigynum]|uniref:glucose-1-phosphate adenylyltransferase n=1 Tax=Linum trigynum TaxID=586398 RepID=A0AAV2FGP0_9ROSI
MGSKLKTTPSSVSSHRSSSNKVAKQPVITPVVADLFGSNLRDLEMERRDPRTVVAVFFFISEEELVLASSLSLNAVPNLLSRSEVHIGCINSGINKVYILTQYNSALLNRHLGRAYNFGSGTNFGDGYVEALAATQTPGETGKKWFQGTADAVRQFHWLFEDARSKEIEDVLILSVLGDHLCRMDYMDFVQAYLFNDYWEDIGTVRSFFEANLALTEHPPRFSFYDAAKPIYTSRRNLPPSKIDSSKIVDSIISHGSFLTDCHIEHSVVGIRSRINANVHLKVVSFKFCEVASLVAEGRVPVGIGENTKIRECIINKNARIGKNVTIANSEGIQEADRASEGFYIRSGVTVIFKNAVIEDGFVI